MHRSDGKPLVRSNGVCELHFREEDIEKYFITNLKDGSIFKMAKGKPNLKLDAVPCKLLNGDLNIARSSCPSEPKTNDISEYHLEVIDHLLSPMQEDIILSSCLSEPETNDNSKYHLEENQLPPTQEFSSTVKEYESQSVITEFSLAQDLYDTVILPTEHCFSKVFSDKIIWTQCCDESYSATFRVILLQNMNLQVSNIWQNMC